MSETIAGELRQTFQLLAMRREAERLQNPRQLTQARTIMEKAASARAAEHQAFKDDYSVRLEKAQRQLIDEAGSKTRDFTPRWAAHDRFDRQAIHGRAQHIVRADYERSIAAINQAEHRDLAQHLNRSERENALRGKARDDFTRSMDRRTGPDRRKTGPEQ